MLLYILLIFGPFISPAHAIYEVKDTIYFMKDDNEFSPEEMEEEAVYVHGICSKNVLQSSYFDCKCIAGAYRQEREKVGPYKPQNHILNELFDENERGCANTEQIAGEAYSYCINYSESFRYREKNNEEYCKCVANKMALSFQKEPRLSMSYISKLRVNALSACE